MSVLVYIMQYMLNLIEKILGKSKANDKKDEVATDYWQTFTSYAPVFSSFSGGIYEQELTRAAVERFAVSCSKLEPHFVGSCNKPIVKIFDKTPNSQMTWSQFLSRLATILECDTTAYVIPSYNDRGDLVGIYPLKAELAEIVVYDNEPWIRFTLSSGEVLAIELDNVAILTKFQYQSDYFGTGNVLDSTMSLIHTQVQSEQAAMKNGAAIRFIGKLTGQVREEDIEKKRERFSEENLSSKNDSGIILYDNTFDSVQQLENSHYTMGTAEMERIEEHVFTYFGTNKDILQNSYNEDGWGAYYEGKIEPFAIQLGEALTRMLFSSGEQKKNKVVFSASRLSYASNASKRNMIRDMVDRGIMTVNEAREVLQLPSVNDGDRFIIRGEYIPADTIEAHALKRLPMSDEDDNDFDLGGDDQIYNDTDARGKDE